MERLFPPDLLAVQIPEREQRRHKLLSRYRAHGLLGANGSGELWPGTGGAAMRTQLRRELQDRGEIFAVAVEGVRGERYGIGDELPLLAQAEREIATEAGAEVAADGSAEGAARDVSTPPGCSFIAPLDPLLWDRGVLIPLYAFDYRWEVYTPAVKRRWGYYVLPILFGDRLVGRIEPRIDRRVGLVRLLSLSWEAGFDPIAAPGFVSAFAAALNAYLAFGAGEALLPPQDAAHRALFAEVASAVPVRRAADTTRPRAEAPRRTATARPAASTWIGRSAARYQPDAAPLPIRQRANIVPLRNDQEENQMAAIRRATVSWTGDLAS